MYVDANYQAAITRAAPQTGMRLTFLDGAREVIDGTNSLIDSNFDFIGKSLFGDFPSRQFKAQFLYEIKTDYTGRTFQLDTAAYEEDTVTAHWIPVGIFEIPTDGQQSDEMNKTITITAYDNVSDFEQQYELIDLGADGLTGAAIEKILVERNNFALDPNRAPLLFDNHVFKQINIGDGTEITDREVLQQYYRMNMANAFTNRNSKVIHTPCIFTATPITNGVSFQYDATEFKLENLQGPINSIVYANQADGDDASFNDIIEQDVPSIEANGLTEIKFYNNVFMDLMTVDEKLDMLQTMFTIVNGYTYASFDITMFARPDFDPFDVLPLTNSDGTVTPVPIVSLSYKYNGGLIGVMKTPTIPETTTDYENGFDRAMRNAQTRTRIIVDQIRNEIRLIVERVDVIDGEVTDISSTIMLLDEKIQLEVSERIGENDAIRSEVSSAITQLKDSITLEFTRIESDINAVGDNLEELKTYYRFDANGALIGKSGDPFTLSISNTEIDFMENGNIIAYVNGQKMFIQSLEVITQAIIGNHVIERFEGTTYSGTVVRQSGGE